MLFLLLSENVYKYHISLKLGSIILVQSGFYEIQEKICPENRISSKLYIFRKNESLMKFLRFPFIHHLTRCELNTDNEAI